MASALMASIDCSVDGCRIHENREKNSTTKKVIGHIQALGKIDIVCLKHIHVYVLRI